MSIVDGGVETQRLDRLQAGDLALQAILGNQLQGTFPLSSLGFKSREQNKFETNFSQDQKVEIQ